MIQVKYVMMETQITTMAEILCVVLLSLDGDAQATIRVNDYQYDKMG